MAEPNSSTARPFDWILLAFGVVMAGGGFFFTLVFLGHTRSPNHIYGPNWLEVPRRADILRSRPFSARSCLAARS
jgi:hypothetical protein